MSAHLALAPDRAAGRRAPGVSPELRRVWYMSASLALLSPCYWQSRIQAGDLSSHIYNTWLATLIESGRTEGLAIVQPATNVLFDVILSGLFRWLGPEWAQRLAVSVAVLIFTWGAFAFVSAVSGRAAWPVLPCIAALAYGWVFHMGFFNFYMALGLSFFALALSWEFRPRKAALAASLFAVAYTAHALPVGWALALIAYRLMASRVPETHRARLLGVVLVLLLGAHAAISRTMASKWSVFQLSSATGADQIWVFDDKYYFLMPVLLLVWGWLFLNLLRSCGGHSVAASIPFHWCVLSAAGVFVLPGTVLIPGFHHALVYIAERMSLAVGICVCALVAAAPLPRLPRTALAGVAAIFFVFLFRDEVRLNRFEDRVDQAVAHLPPAQRVISPIIDDQERADALTHMIDRACIGRCYSYANYEPSTAQFRIRAIRPNPFVVSEYGDSFDLQWGKYVVQPRDPPLMALGVSDGGAVTIRRLQPGVPSGLAIWNVLRNRRPNN